MRHSMIIKYLLHLCMIMVTWFVRYAVLVDVIVTTIVGQGHPDPLLVLQHVSELVIARVVDVDQSIIQPSSDLDHTIRAVPQPSELLALLLTHQWHMQPDLLAQAEWLISLVMAVTLAVVLLCFELMALGHMECVHQLLYQSAPIVACIFLHSRPR